MVKPAALDWLIGALLAFVWVGGLYALIWWANSYRRRQLDALFDAIKARGIRKIVVQVEEEK